LHAQAVELIKNGEMKKARDLLDQAWKATPHLERGRSLVLNRAIVDLSDKQFVMRALRDVTDYLVAHKQREDEQATDILGVALNNSAGDAQRQRGELWQSAFKEWDRRNELLDQSRPGLHHWGTQWLTDDQYAELRGRQREVEQAIRAQAKNVDAAERRAGAIAQTVGTMEFLEKESIFFPPEDVGANPLRSMSPLARIPEPLSRAGPNDPRRYEADLEAAQNRVHDLEVAGNYRDARAELNWELGKLYDLMAQRERPKWPTEFAPLEP
jgi:hypothetical protein